MRSPLYKLIFPSTVLDKSAVDHIRTTLGGYRYATAVGSDITGRRDFAPHAGAVRASAAEGRGG
jgi:hypothetical protein